MRRSSSLQIREKKVESGESSGLCFSKGEEKFSSISASQHRGGAPVAMAGGREASQSLASSERGSKKGKEELARCLLANVEPSSQSFSATACLLVG